MPGIINVFGGAGIGQGAFSTQEQADELAKVLKAGDVNIIDTATLYGPSEENIAKFGLPKQFTIDTKTVGGIFGKGSGTKKAILEHAEQSEKHFGKVDIWYIHTPDEGTPLEEQLEGINEVYKRGFFKRFGISNFSPEMVQQVYDIAKAKGYPLPSVYQGNYNPAARKQEDVLIPLLRKLNIAFYAYSPIAGGFLTKSKEDIANKKGRFDPSTQMGRIYSAAYAKPELLDALAEWQSIAEEEGVPRAELAYRWVKYNSSLKPEFGDALIIGASSIEQLKQTLEAIKKGPLSDKATKRIDHFWQSIKHVAPLDNLNN
ncbi:hypothetical protein MRB53_040644 [Persea americana]|nr:hypothetical protein MRB53_040644 [Persea americana]